MKTVKEMIDHAVEASVKSLQEEANHFDSKQVREFVNDIKNIKPFDMGDIHGLEHSYTFILNEIRGLEVVYEKDDKKSKSLYKLKRNMQHILYHIKELEFLTSLEKSYNSDKSMLQYRITEEEWRELNNNLVQAYELLNHDEFNIVHGKEYMIELFEKLADHLDDGKLVSCLLNSLDLVDFLKHAEYLFGYNDKNILPDDIKKKTIYQTPQVLLSVLNPHSNLLKEMMLTERLPTSYSRESIIEVLELAIREHISSIMSAFNDLEHHREDIERVKPSWKNSKEMFDKLDASDLEHYNDGKKSYIKLQLPSTLKSIVLYMWNLKHDLYLDTYNLLVEDEGRGKLNMLLSSRLKKQIKDRIEYIMTLARVAGFLSIISGRLRAKGYEEDPLHIGDVEVDVSSVIDKETAIKILNARINILHPKFKSYTDESHFTRYYYPYNGYVNHTHKALITLTDLEIVRVALIEAIEVFGSDVHHLALYMLDKGILDSDSIPLIRYYANTYDECNGYITDEHESYEKYGDDECDFE